MAQKIKLDEAAFKEYIAGIINEEVDEWLGLSRAERNARWGYEWDDNLTRKQNKALRNVNKQNIKAAGYNNADEYNAAKAAQATQTDPSQQQDTTQQQQDTTQQQQNGIPEVYPYKSDRNKTGEFQTWFNDNMCGPNNPNPAQKLVVDGKWGRKTEAAYQLWLSRQNQ